MRDIIFVSSPVYGIEEYRKAARKVLDSLRMLPARADDISFDFYMYEKFFAQARHDPSKTYTQEIMQHFKGCFNGDSCSIFLLFFSTRIGNGTREEVEHFKTVLLQENPTCELWWRKLPSNDEPDEADVSGFTDQLYEFNEQLPDLAYDISDVGGFSGWLTMTLYERFKIRRN
jgi:hypothetical protein